MRCILAKLPGRSRRDRGSACDCSETSRHETTRSTSSVRGRRTVRRSHAVPFPMSIFVMRIGRRERKRHQNMRLVGRIAPGGGVERSGILHHHHAIAGIGQYVSIDRGPYFSPAFSREPRSASARGRGFGNGPARTFTARPMISQAALR
jgi:hypothetical protein